MMKCPICNSERVTQNERGDKKCQKCGWIHLEGKQPVIFTAYTNKEVSEIDKAFKRLGLE
jgi:ribosomal protein L37AE/L43A